MFRIAPKNLLLVSSKIKYNLIVRLKVALHVTLVCLMCSIRQDLVFDLYVDCTLAVRYAINGNNSHKKIVLIKIHYVSLWDFFEEFPSKNISFHDPSPTNSCAYPFGPEGTYVINYS